MNLGQHFLDGIEHITDPAGFDHMLFLLALCAPYTWKQWKPIVLLATAFTLGHSISLGLAAFGLVRVASYYIELLIPVTIVAMGISNIAYLKQPSGHVPAIKYLTTIFFGLIHGLGFSSFFRMIYDETSSLIKSLLLFNLGVETGQLIIVATILILTWIVVRIAGVNQKLYTQILSSVAIGLGTWLLIENM